MIPTTPTTSTTPTNGPTAAPRPTGAGPAGSTMGGLRWFSALAAVTGTVVPWIFFGSFLSAEGADLVGFVRALFDNGAAGGFSADLLITATVFWVWSYRDSRTADVAHWWLVVPATMFVGLSLAFPLYLFWREPSS